MWIKELTITSFARCWALLLGLACANLALAQAPAATGEITVAETSGTLRYRIGDSEPRMAAKGEEIPLGARITTGANSSVVLVFPDRMIVALGEQSRLRVLDFGYLPKEPGKSRVVLNLTEGSVRIALGAIGQRDPGLIRILVGEGSLTQALGLPRSGEITLTVREITALLQVGQGKVSLSVEGRSYALASGQGALVQASGVVQVVGQAQLADAAGLTDEGRILRGRLETLKLPESALAQAGRQTSITLSTLPSFDLDEDETALLTTPPTTSATGAAGGGGNPRAASPN